MRFGLAVTFTVFATGCGPATTHTTPSNSCGNGSINAGEMCDGSELEGQSCTGLGFAGGTLACSAGCSAYDTTNCEPVSDTCGDGVRDEGETCDGTDLDGHSCEGLSLFVGTLTCAQGCGAFDTAGCTCGNGVRDDGEACDGTDLGGQTCEGLGLGVGHLGCTSTCEIDIGDCPTCGDGVRQDGEVCDGTDLNGHTCQSLGFAGGTLACVAEGCTFDTTACEPDSIACGDGVRDDAEPCDGALLDGHTCVGLGFAGGTLSCAPTCDALTTLACVPNTCGDGVRDDGEICDGADLGQTCEGLGFAGGTLACMASCDGFNTAGCTSASSTCGDGVVQEGEECDGMGNYDFQNCASLGYAAGVIRCHDNCSLNPLGCHTSTGGTLAPDPTPSVVDLPFDPDVTYVQDLHVDASAADGGNGSPEAPFNDIRDALLAATAGTRVLIQPGIYRAMNRGVDDLRGTAEAPIAVIGVGDGVIIDGSLTAPDWRLGFVLTRPEYLLIENLTIRNAFPHGINIDDGLDVNDSEGTRGPPAHHIILRNLDIQYVGNGGNNDCIKLSGVDDFYVGANNLGTCEGGESVDLMGCHRGVISGNYIHDMSLNALNTKGGSADVLIHGNVFHNIRRRSVLLGGSSNTVLHRPEFVPGQSFEGNRIRVLSNIFYTDASTEWINGFASTTAAFVGCDSCVFANNTVVEPRGSFIWIVEENLEGQPSRNGQVINNLVIVNNDYHFPGWGYVNTDDHATPESFSFGNNLYYCMDCPGAYEPIATSTGEITEVDTRYQQHPMLANYAQRDFHIQQGSAAGGAGRVVNGLLVDRAGRAYADPPSIGAFELPAP